MANWLSWAETLSPDSEINGANLKSKVVKDNKSTKVMLASQRDFLRLILNEPN